MTLNVRARMQESDMHKIAYRRMRSKLNTLKTDPVLWINGPQLNQNQGVETDHKEKNTRKTRAWITPNDVDMQANAKRFRPSILPGFNPADLRSYCHDVGPTIAGAYELTKLPDWARNQAANHLFSTDCVTNSGLRGEERFENDKPRKSQLDYDRAELRSTDDNGR